MSYIYLIILWQNQSYKRTEEVEFEKNRTFHGKDLFYGVKRRYDGDLAQAQWQEFSVDLASLGINLGNVTSLTIGFETGASGGSGTIFLDDIRLYAPQE